MSQISPAEYLREALALDPTTQSEAILDLRDRFLGAPAGPSAARGLDPDERAQDLERLRELSRRFWQLDDEEFDRALERCAATRQPDLRRWVGRLERAAAVRGAFRDLEEDPDVPRSMVKALRWILVSSPSDAVQLRRKHAWEGRPSIKEAGARHVLRHHPEVAALELEHLRKMAVLQKERQLSLRPGAAGAALGSFFLIYMAIKILLAFLRHGLG